MANRRKNKAITFYVTEIVTKSLEDIYETKTFASCRAAESWIHLRTKTLDYLKSKFVENELKLLIDISNATIFSQYELYVNNDVLIAEIKDSCKFNEMDKKWDIDKKILIKKIQKLSPAECYFLQEWASMFWNTKDQNLDDYIKELL